MSNNQLFDEARTRAGAAEAHEHPLPEVGSDRRVSMKRMLVGTGATAFAAMGGTALLSSTASAADPTSTPSPPAGSAATPPSNGGPGGGMTMQTSPTDDFFGLTHRGLPHRRPLRGPLDRRLDHPGS